MFFQTVILIVYVLTRTIVIDSIFARVILILMLHGIHLILLILNFSCVVPFYLADKSSFNGRQRF